MKRWLFATAFVVGLGACTGDEDCASVDGTLCTDCANDCLSIQTSCEAPKERACVGLSYFDGEPSAQRCVFCVAPE
ncbi:MAG: hypothetical protein RIT81_24870 [Deltaproteobacteria bacterium]